MTTCAGYTTTGTTSRERAGGYRNKCSRTGTIFEEGKHWCKSHAPSIVAEKHRLINDRIAAEIDAVWGKHD